MAAMEPSHAKPISENPSRTGSLRVRSSSIGNERSLIGSPTSAILSNPFPVSPEPTFIAASAASQIVTNDHDHQADAWFDQYGVEPSGQPAVVTPNALKLVNGFLDQLLYSFVATGKSTSLTALRPAVVEVLKPKLAKDAINGADQELQDYLGNGEDELLDFGSDSQQNNNWDLETIWKRTRLRCMVYSSLGDMEEEDEDYHVEQQESGATFIVSPAVAIFLTSILEFIGEQALVIAGQQAYHRMRARREKDGSIPSSPIDVGDRVVVEEQDMDKVALDRTLGRLWRGWRKRLRSPTMTSPRSLSRDSFKSARDRSRSNSASDEDERRPSIMEVIDQEYAASVPLPISENDVREIEIPGFALFSNHEALQKDKSGRPKSMFVPSQLWTGLLTPDEPISETQRPKAIQRARSNSLPTPAPSPIETYFLARDVASNEATAETDEVVEDKKETAKLATQPKADLESIGEEKVAVTERKIKRKSIHTGEIKVPSASEDKPTTSKDSVAERYFVERPRIMTSHRVSVSGIDSPLSPVPSGTQSPSVHSVRLIEVASRTGRSSQSGGSTPVTRSSSTSPFPRNRSPDKDERSSNESVSKSVDPTPNASLSSVGSRDSSMQGAARVSSTPTSSEFRSGAAKAMQGNMQAPQPRLSIMPVEKKQKFVLSPAPVTQRKTGNGAVPTKDVQYESPVVSRGPSTGESSAPPLTPLRETTEGVTGSSDEESYKTASTRVSDNKATGHSATVSSASVGRRPVTTEKPSHRTKKDVGPKASFENRSKRSTSVSSSATSQSNKIKPMRTSSDYGDDGKGKSFDELIRSDETIQYTLTPENMREVAPKRFNPPVTVIDSQRRAQNSMTSPITIRPQTAKSNVTINKHTGLRSNPPSDLPGLKHHQSAPRSTSGMSRVRSAGGPQARDARIERESIGDFADFIRSTGPPGSHQLPPRVAHTSSGHSTRNSALILNTSASAVIPPPRPNTSTPVRNTSTPVRRSESSARRKLLAREAVVPHGDNNSDLIDFIRQGPPSENHRIPRSVAPFRSTMDSDQMVGAITERPLELALPPTRNSQASTNVPESMHSSVNSQSALLAPGRRPVALAQSHSTLGNSDFGEEDMMPKRKTRRVRDPYAIDLSDEEDEELFAMAAMTSKKPEREEESLIDFLNNVPPPPPSPPRVAAAETSPIKKKPSRGLMARFTRSSSIVSSNADIENRSSYSRSSSISHSSTAPPVQPPVVSRTGTAHSNASTINQSHYSNGHSQYQPDKPKSYQPARGNTGGNYVSQLNTERKPSSSNGSRVAQRSYQPKEALHGRTDAEDLAEFLMSGPPPNMMRDTPSEPFILSSDHSGNSGSFSKMFRKKGRVM